MTLIIDGKNEAKGIREGLKVIIEECKSIFRGVPGLTVILVGEDPASKIYVKNKEKFAKEVGMNSEVIRYSADLEEKELLNKIKDLIEKVASTDAKILVCGPNGSGKELVARSIHSSSNRAHNPLIEVNCAAIPSELIESELFGHVKGSFTGAVKDKTGKFEAANSGTIFLDEVGDMSLSAQAKVLRVLQDNCIQKVGGGKDIRIDVRVIAATNKDLKKEIDNGKFREDLYHRLAVIVIDVPSLNKRKEDIPLLIDHFCKNICKSQGIKEKKFSKPALKLLKSMDWSGNVRELRNVVERLIILGDEKEISEKNVKQFAK